MEHEGASVTKLTFARVFSKAWEETTSDSMIARSGMLRRQYLERNGGHCERTGWTTRIRGWSNSLTCEEAHST